VTLNRWLQATQSALIVAACAAAVPASAQLFKYDSEDEVMGAAVSSPESTRRILERLVAKCGAYGDAVKAPADKALAAWMVRHQAYLDEGRRVKKELQARFTVPEARRKFDDMFDKQLPIMVDRQYEVYASSIDAMPVPAGKAQMCGSYIDAIVEKKFDLASNDPTLTAFFDKRIKAGAGKR